MVLIRQKLGLRGLILPPVQMIADALGSAGKQLSLLVTVLLGNLLFYVKLWLVRAGPEERIYRATSWRRLGCLAATATDAVFVETWKIL